MSERLTPEREALVRQRAAWKAPHEAHNIALLRDTLAALDAVRAERDRMHDLIGLDADGAALVRRLTAERDAAYENGVGMPWAHVLPPPQKPPKLGPVRKLDTPCPFCGDDRGYTQTEYGEGVVTGQPRESHVVICRSCAAWGPWSKVSKAGAHERWNARAKR